MLSTLIANLRPLLHPMLVHFPIALLFASVALDALGWLLRRPSLTRAGFFSLVLGTAGAGVAAITGPDHVQGDATVQSLLANHQSFALITVALAVALVLVRLTAIRGLAGGPALAYLGGAVLLLVALSLTGYFGGELTYHQGIGVAVAQPALAAAPMVAGPGVPVKPLVALLGLLASGVIGGWVALGWRAQDGYFAAWWRALRRESDDGGTLWTLRRAGGHRAEARAPSDITADQNGQAAPRRPAERTA
jgi:uncharacterized membrane protein